MGIIEQTLKQEGVPVSDRDNYLPGGIDSSEELFKLYLANPERASEFVEYLTNEVDEKTGVQLKVREAIPRLVRTMALGNLTTQEVKATRYLLSLGDTLFRLGYTGIAVFYYNKVVELNVTSQPHMGNMLRQLLIHSVGIQRTENIASQQADLTGQEPSIVDKIKEKLKSSQGGRPGLGMGTPPGGSSGGNPFFNDR